MEKINPKLKNDLNLELIVERMQMISKQLSIKKWDLGGSCSEETSVQVDNGEAKQLKGSQCPDDGIVRMRFLILIHNYCYLDFLGYPFNSSM